MLAPLGLLFVGHGTRDAAGQAEFLATARLVGERWPGPIEPCFLELAEPSIEASLARLVERGCRRVVVAPLLLFAAGHAKRDIPAAVAKAAQKYPGLEWRQAEHLGLHPAVVELSARRFYEACASDDADRLTVDDPPRPPVAALCSVSSPLTPHRSPLASHPSTLLVLVGRGSLDAGATAEIHQFARLRSELTSVVATEVCFAAMAEPRLSDCLARICERRATDWADVRQVVVQPHLLFAGELLYGVRAVAAGFAEQCPQWDWRISEHLGCDDSLAEAIVQRARAAAGDWISATPRAIASVDRQ